MYISRIIQCSIDVKFLTESLGHLYWSNYSPYTSPNAFYFQEFALPLQYCTGQMEMLMCMQRERLYTLYIHVCSSYIALLVLYTCTCIWLNILSHKYMYLPIQHSNFTPPLLAHAAKEVSVCIFRWNHLLALSHCHDTQCHDCCSTVRWLGHFSHHDVATQMWLWGVTLWRV